MLGAFSSEALKNIEIVASSVCSHVTQHGIPYNNFMPFPCIETHGTNHMVHCIESYDTLSEANNLTNYFEHVKSSQKRDKIITKFQKCQFFERFFFQKENTEIPVEIQVSL